MAWLGVSAALGLSVDPAGAAGSAAAAAAVRPLGRTTDLLPAPLWQHMDPALGEDLDTALHRLGLGGAVERGRLGVALVDVTDLEHPRVAALNGDAMFYAASLPKIAIMLAVFEKAWAGDLELDGETWQQLAHMIRASSNADSTALMHKVGKPYIAQVLLAPRYRLYDPLRGGGLWAGKDYAKHGVWRRDPLSNLSHAATPMQVARFFYLLQSGQLVSRDASDEMKELMAETAIEHKFVKGLRGVRPHAAIFRKSGTWRDWHADAALVERRDGASYIAVGLAESPQGGDWLSRIIVAIDALIEGNPRAHARTSVR